MAKAKALLTLTAARSTMTRLQALQSNKVAFEDKLHEIEQSAFNASNANESYIETVGAVCGKAPTVAVYSAARLAGVAGYMAGNLARRADSIYSAMKTEQLVAYCVDRITNYQGATGTAPISKGMKGRRSPEEEAAYSTARSRWSNCCERAGVEVPKEGVSGGANNKKGNNGKAKAEEPKEQAPAAEAPPSSVPVAPKFKSQKEAIDWAGVVASALLAAMNKNAKVSPAWLKSAVGDFKTAVDKQTAATRVVTK